MTPAELIREVEGCKLVAYPDPATGGKPWTIGYGCTGPGIGPGLIWTQEHADLALNHRLAVLMPRVREMLHTPPTEGQFAALCSFAWNEGDSALEKSTLLKKLNAGDVRGAADEFLLWERAGADKHLLHGRRAREQEVFLSPPGAH